MLAVSDHRTSGDRFRSRFLANSMRKGKIHWLCKWDPECIALKEARATFDPYSMMATLCRKFFCRAVVAYSKQEGPLVSCGGSD